jgi:hypothetical protein
MSDSNSGSNEFEKNDDATASREANKGNAPGESPEVSLPRTNLQPARLLTRAALRKAEASQVLSAMRGERTGQGNEALSPLGTGPKASAGKLQPKQLLSKELPPEELAPRPAERPALRTPVEPPAATTRPSYVTGKPRAQAGAAPTFGYSASGQKPPSEAQGMNELQALLGRVARTVSPYAGRALEKTYRSISSWRRPQLSWKLVATAAAVVAAFMLSDRPEFSDGYTALTSKVQPYVDQVKSRAAFQIIDHFDNGVGDWWDDHGLVADQGGAVRVAGLSLHRDTMDLSSYRMDFEARIDSRSVGWVVRAADRETFYAFKLLQSGKKDKSYKLVRYPVVEGKPDLTQKAELDVPADLMTAEYNRISMRTQDNQLVTFINGRSVDFWRDSRLPRGGVGFWVEKGESGRVRLLAVSGNEDFWGLTLYAAMETAHAVNHFVSSLVSNPKEVADGLQQGVGNLTEGVKKMTPVSWTN